MESDQPLTLALPDLASRLINAAKDGGRLDVAEQLQKVRLKRATYEQDVDAGYIYVTESRCLNAVESNIVGVKHGECVVLSAMPGTIVIDLDNFGRLMGVELLGYVEVFRQLGLAA